MGLILDSSGSPMRAPPTEAPVRYTRDGLGAAFSTLERGYGGYGAQTSLGMRQLTSQLAIAAYLSSGLLRKCIDIPAADRVREWRDWQADSDHIGLLEDEEKRLDIIAKVKFAEVLRGIGGGALILALPGDPATPVGIVAKGALAAVNGASRWQLQLVDVDTNMAATTYGQPAMFRINGGTKGAQDIHPSRVIPFRGDPIPAGFGVSSDDAYWGASRLERVIAEVRKSDDASQWFAELVKKAKLLRFGISGLGMYDQTDLNARVALIAQSENSLNATIYNLPAKDGTGAESGGEKIDDFQVSWNGIPAVQDMFDQRVAAVSDIPFTRLMGRSPAGMNATGQHDMDNHDRAIMAGQKLELKPCLDRLDEVLIPSAGVDPAKVTWAFAPMSTPSEAEDAVTFDKTMDALTKLQATNTIPDVAFTKGAQNLMSEREWVPGLDQALAEIPETERFGITPDAPGVGGVDPSALTQQPKGGDPNLAGAMGSNGSGPVARAANDARFNDATPRTLYVSRKLLNASEFIAWAKSQGFTTTTPADELHVTITYSRTPVDWMKMGATWDGGDKGELTVAPGGARIVELLGDKGAVVLLFASSSLSWRHEEMIREGASHDFPEYQPHVTVTYERPDGLDLSKVEPFRGALRFGPEIFEELDTDWKPGEA